MQITEQQIKLARDKFKEISGITIYTPDEGTLDDFEQSRYDGFVAALEAALSTDGEPVAWMWSDTSNGQGFDTKFSEYEPSPSPYISGEVTPLYDRPQSPCVGVKPLEDELYSRGYGLRCAIVDFLNGIGTKQDLRQRFTDWVSAPGTRFSISPASRYTLSSQVQDVSEGGLTLSALQSAHFERQEEWCPDVKPDLSFRGNELGGECGEAQNVIKKLERERHGWRGSRDTIEHLAEELADVIHCTMLVAITAGIDLQQSVVRKFNDTSAKNGLSTLLAAAPAKQEGKP